MDPFSEYPRFDGLGLAELVRRKDVTPLELAECAIARVERHNPRINAVVRPMFDDGRERARRLDASGPFAGVPFLLKDLLADYAGEPTSNGSALYRECRPGRHAEIVNRYLAAGLVVVGKTNTPEFDLAIRRGSPE
jgi:amidase